MLVRFSSTATEPLIMFGDVAIQLIKMMGASGTIPGALYAADIPAAITRLRQQLALLGPSVSKATTSAKPHSHYQRALCRSLRYSNAQPKVTSLSCGKLTEARERQHARPHPPSQ